VVGGSVTQRLERVTEAMDHGYPARLPLCAGENTCLGPLRGTEAREPASLDNQGGQKTGCASCVRVEDRVEEGGIPPELIADEADVLGD